jgi:hypothetical protein
LTYVFLACDYSDRKEPLYDEFFAATSLSTNATIGESIRLLANDWHQDALSIADQYLKVGLDRDDLGHKKETLLQISERYTA